MNVVITGTNKGLGLCLLKVFAENGHKVVAGIYEKYNFSQVTEYIDNCKYKDNIILVPMDVSNEDMVKKAAEKSYINFGPIDVVINVAGILLPTDRTDTILNGDIDVLRKSIEINTIGTVIVMKHFYKYIKKDGTGIMIFVTSEAGSVTNSGSNFPAYSISKAAANKAVFILRSTVQNQVKVYAMHPGRMNTDMGKTTAQIEPEESAIGIYKIVTGETHIYHNTTGFINYKGEEMTI
ncbi:SDR family NAD(P)-dependent oxidoreductase [Caldicellulosiruptoraceae bacterium PP1]